MKRIILSFLGFACLLQSVMAAGDPVPTVSVTPKTLDFKQQLLKQASAEKSVTVKNTGTMDVKLSSTLEGSKDFSIAKSSTCNSQTPLVVGTDCQLNVVFKPTVVGTLEATLTVKSGQEMLASVALKGTGEEAKSALSIKPSTLSFGKQLLKTASAEKSVTLTNKGTADAKLTSAIDNKDFSLAKSSTCGKTVAAGANCQLNVVFKPSVAGDLTGTLMVTSGSDTLSVSLSGTGEEATSALSIKPSSLSFGKQLLKTASAEKSVTLTNKGTADAKLTSAIDNKDFSLAKSSTCGKTVAAGANCQLNVVFKPSVAGDLTGTLMVTSGSDTLSVSLSGTGEEATSALSIKPSSLSFGKQLLKTASAEETVTLTNKGNADAKLTTAIDNKDFSLAKSSTCGKTVAAGANCQLNMVFKPSVAGDLTGTLTVTSGIDSLSVSLKGTGEEAKSALSIKPSSLSFGKQLLKTDSAEETVTLTNKGNADAKLTTAIDNKDFSLAKSSTCGKTVAAGANCQLNVVFKPSVAGDLTGTLTVTSGIDSLSISLKGTGEEAKSALSIKPSSLSFGKQLLKTASAEETVTLTNKGNADAKLTTAIDNKDFSLAKSSTCGKTVAAGANCQLNVVFKPSVAGDLTGTLTVTSGIDSLSVSLKGTGEETKATITAAPSNLSYGNYAIKVESAKKTVTVTNTGNAEVKLSAVLEGTNNKDFIISKSSTCSQSPLAINGECQIDVTSKPTVAGDLEATLAIKSGQDTLASVALKATGVETQAGITATPNTLSFGNQPLNQVSAEKTVTLKNQGKEDVKLSVDMKGDNSDEFEIATSSTCQTVLAVGENCQVNIIFKPLSNGEKEANLNVKVDDYHVAGIVIVGTGGEGQTYPLLGNAAAVNAQGNSVEAPNLQFSGGIAVVDKSGKVGEFKSNVSITLKDAIVIDVMMKVPPEQQGRTAEFFSVGFYSPTGTCSGKKEDGAYYAIVSLPHEHPEEPNWYCPWGGEACPPSSSTKSKDFMEWNNEIPNLPPFKIGVLQESNMIHLIDKLHFVLPGFLCLTTGYRLEENGTVYFHDKSIDIKITE